MATAYYGQSFYKQLQRKQPAIEGLLNTMFMSSVNMATKMLLSVASNNYFSTTASFYGHGIRGLSGGGLLNKWKAKDHFQFMLLLFSWFSMWAFRVISDFLPSGLFSSNKKIKTSSPSSKLWLPGPRRSDQVCRGTGDNNEEHVNGDDDELALVSSSTTSFYSYSNSPVQNQNLDLIPLDGFLVDGADYSDHDGHSVQALGRALTHILSLLSELPATSRKYEFAMAMADRILDENTRDGNLELLQVNRMALSSAFECTTAVLYRTLDNAATSHAQANILSGDLTTRLISKLPLGSYITAYMNGGLSAIFPALDSMLPLQKRRLMTSSSQGDSDYIGSDHSLDVIGAEKLAQELLWIINKLRACRAVDEALVQWSLASGLASLSLNANPRVQASLIKISASLIGDIARAEFQVPIQVQYRLLVLWLPLFCYASSGLRYPVLSSYEKIEVERIMEQMIAALPSMEQEIVLRNWLQDYAVCSSDWPNLRPSYDRWCQFSRRLAT